MKALGNVKGDAVPTQKSAASDKLLPILTLPSRSFLLLHLRFGNLKLPCGLCASLVPSLTKRHTLISSNLESGGRRCDAVVIVELIQTPSLDRQGSEDVAPE